MAPRRSIRQRDASDCGPACLASVMAHHGARIPVSRIRQVARTGPDGTTMLGMIQALEHFSFEAAGLEGEADRLDQLPLPFIAHLVQPGGMHHYVAVYRIRRRGLRIMDPATGKAAWWSMADFLEQWSRAVIALVPASRVQEVVREVPRSRRFLALLRPVWKPLLLAVVSALLHTVLGLSFSLYLGKLADHVLVTRNYGLLNLMSLVMLWITGLMTYLGVSRNLTMLRTGQIMDNQLIASYYRQLLRLPMRFFDSMQSGEILSRINDAVKIRTFINDAAIAILVNLLTLLFSFATMFFLHPRLALVILPILPVYAGIYALYDRRNRRMERSVMEASAGLESRLVESLEAMRHIRQHNLQGRAQQGTEGKLNRLLDRVFGSGTNAITASGATEAVNRLFTVLLLWTGSSFVLGGSLSTGNLLTFYALLGYFTGPAASLIGANRTYQNAMIAADRLFEIFELEGEEPPGRTPFRRELFGDIALKGVDFSYGNHGSLLKGLDLLIPAGKVTVLTGASGSGKSTIAGLVQLLYPVDAGCICIGDCDTRNFTGESIRALMGVVPQQLTFLSGTLLENLAPGEAEPDIARITLLLKDAGLLPLVESLPGSLSTRISGNGSDFSGGERQRLALVRALYPDPPMLILDEAASSLDPVSEVHVHRMLLTQKALGKTLLLITHKPGFQALADRVLAMERGRVRELSVPSGR